MHIRAVGIFCQEIVFVHIVRSSRSFLMLVLHVALEYGLMKWKWKERFTAGVLISCASIHYVSPTETEVGDVSYSFECIPQSFDEHLTARPAFLPESTKLATAEPVIVVPTSVSASVRI